MYKRVMEQKQAGKYIPTYETTEKIDVLEWLTNDMRQKYLNKAGYIKRITHKTGYDKHATITVYYSNDTRSIYTIEI